MLFHIPSVATPSRELARRVLHNVETLNERSRRRLATNSETLRSFVRERDDLDGFVAPGSTVAFLEHRSADGDAVVEAALEAGILVVPGRFFGDDAGFRISVAREPDSVTAALDAFRTVLDGLAD
jgi:aspartate/methionine/tyrosine aminotransferase